MAGPVAAFIVTVVLSAFLLTFVHRSPPRPAGANAATWRATANDFAVPEWFSSLPLNCMAGIGLGVSGTPALAHVTGVRTGAHAALNLVTVQFAGDPPERTSISAQIGATFSPAAGSKPVTLTGRYGALVTMQTADGHSSYSGPPDIKTGDRLVLELRKLVDVGGEIQWAIGLSEVPCFRAGYLDHPTRLVIDFHSGG